MSSVESHREVDRTHDLHIGSVYEKQIAGSV